MSIVTRTLASAPGSYATAAEIRASSGLSSIVDISDADLNDVILRATLIFIGHITVRIDGAVPTVMDADRKVFQLPTGLVADLTADAAVDANDIVVRFYKQDTDGQILSSATGTVTVQDALFGVIKTQNALPQDYEAVVDYARYTRPLDLARAKLAVRYLATHLAITRLRAPGRVTRADVGRATAPPSNGADDAALAIRTRWIDLYRREVAAINAEPIV